MTQERYKECHQPSCRVGHEWRCLPERYAGHGHPPMRRGSGTSYDDKPEKLLDQGSHETLNQTNVRRERDDTGWKHILICGDDFGMNSSIDAGILQLIKQHRLHAVSCLTQGPTFAVNGPALRYMNVEVGLHLNFTESFDPRRSYAEMPLSTLITRAYSGRLDRQQVDTHIARQLDAFERVTGRAPDYVDGHQHVHQLPGILSRLLRALTDRYGRRPWLRDTAPGMQTGIPLGDATKARVIGALGARTLARIARNEGWHTNRRLLGVYGLQGGARHYAGLLHQWLANARNGDLIMCHPALTGSADKLGSQRAAEFHVLAHDGLSGWLRQNGITADRPQWSPGRGWQQ